MKLEKSIFPYIVLTLMLQGCMNSCPVEQCGYPDIAFVELATLGGTLTTRNEEIVNVNSVAIPNDGQSVSVRLSFYFTPEEGRENLNEFEENDLFFEISEDYEVRFSQLSSNRILPIAPVFTEWDPPDQDILGYSSAIRFENSEPELLIRRIELSSLAYWNEFIVPLLSEN